MAEHVLETSRLCLDRFDHADAEFVLRLLNEPSFIKNIGDKGVRTQADAIAYLEDGPLVSYERNGFGLWRVSLKEGGAVIGMCGLIKRETLDHPDIGYAFLPECWGMGYALEAVTSVLGHAGSKLGLKVVVAIVSPGNERSQHLLRKLGFTPEGELELPGSEAVVELYVWHDTV